MTNPKKSTDHVILNVGGMACSGCANTVQNAFRNIESVEEATVDLDDESVSLSYDKNAVSTDHFKQAVEDAGYEFKGIRS